MRTELKYLGYAVVIFLFVLYCKCVFMQNADRVEQETFVNVDCDYLSTTVYHDGNVIKIWSDKLPVSADSISALMKNKKKEGELLLSKLN